MRRIATLLALTAALAAAQTAAPKLSLDANGSTTGTLYRGSPLFVQALLWHSLQAERADVPALLLAPASGGWVDRVSIVILAAGGQVSWPLERLGSAEADEISVPKKSRVPMTWWLDSARTAELEPGIYALSAVIEIRDSRGWNGAVRSAPVVISVEVAPTEMTPAQEVPLALLQAREAMTKGSPRRAAGILIEQLSRSPENVTIATAAAGYLEAAGSIELAFAMAEVALGSFNTTAQPSVFPPSDLVQLRNRLAQRIYATGQ